MKRQPTPPYDPAEAHPELPPVVAWFWELVEATRACDRTRALRAQRQVFKLGWSVIERRPLNSPRKPYEGPGGGR